MKFHFYDAHQVSDFKRIYVGSSKVNNACNSLKIIKIQD